MTNPVWKGMEALLPLDRGSYFFDGTFSEPQLNHPEGIAVAQDGSIWCGGERGEIFRIAMDGNGLEQIATSAGFTLGLAFDGDGLLYACDLKHAAVFRLDPRSRELTRFADGDGRGRRIRIPNAPVADSQSGYLYVSDSFDSAEAGPGVWRFELATGKGEMWYDRPLRFANGMAMAPDRKSLYVAETFGRIISRIPIQADGTPGEKELVVKIDALPDGLSFDSRGRLYISCYEPSMLFRWSDARGLELLFYDEEAHLLCHPTNCAFRGNDLFTSNLGRWHVTKLSNVLQEE